MEIDIIQASLYVLSMSVIYLITNAVNIWNNRKLEERKLEIPRIEKVPIETLHAVTDKVSSGIATAITIFATKFIDQKGDNESDIPLSMTVPNASDTLLKQMSREFNSQFERFTREIQQSFNDQDKRLDRIETRLSKLENSGKIEKVGK